MDLPFLIVHGAIVWKLVLVGLLGLVGGLLLGLRRRGARRQAREAVDKLDRTADEGIVRGTLGGADAGPLASTLVVTGVAGVSAYDDCTGELWIETAEGRVALRGAVRVVAGSRAVAARNGVPRATSEALLRAAPSLHRRRPFWAAKMRAATLVSVRAGDEVIASGRLERSASSEPSDYRIGSPVLTLCAPEGGPITLAARAPRVALPRTALPTIALVVGLVAGVGYKVELMVGDAWHDACLDVVPRYGDAVVLEDAPIELTNTHVCSLAAAMPDRRAGALAATLELLERQAYRDEATTRQLFEVARLAETCDQRLERLMDYERYEDAVVEARRCGDRRTEHLALLSQGKLDEAVALVMSGVVPKLPDGAEWIALGQWKEAAGAADAMADALRNQPHEPEYQEYYEQQSLHARCLAELFRSYAGDAGAAERLRALANSRPNACRSVLAQIAPADERAALLKFRSDTIDSAITSSLRWADGSTDEPFEVHSPESLLADPTAFSATTLGPLAWLAKTMPPPETTAGVVAKVTRLRWQTVANVLDDDLAAATTNAQAARALAGPPPDAEIASIDLERERIAKDSEAAGTDRHKAAAIERLTALNQRYEVLAQRETELYQRGNLRDASLLPAIAALYTPSVTVEFDLTANSKIGVELWAYDFGRLWLRHGDPIDKGYFGGDDQFLAALKAAEAGDGRSLAREIGNPRSDWRDADVMAALPRIRIGREALSRQLTWARPPRSRVDGVPLWNLALHAVARREVLRLAGAADAAARWDAIYRRFDRVLGDRRRLVALMLWQRAQ